MTKSNVKNKVGIIRWILLGIILGGNIFISYSHITKGTAFPSVHAICPVGGLENLWVWLAGEANVQKIFSGTMSLFFLTTIFAILFNRSFCGNICPFGALQELFGKIMPKKFTMPKKLDKVLRHLRLVVLMLLTFMAWKTASLWISPYDPWAAFSHISAGSEMFHEYFIGAIILAIVLIGSILYDRFFCKYLCPAGGYYALLAKVSPLKVKRDKESCINCGLCSKACPMNIEVDKVETVKSSECIMCVECINACPKPNVMIKASFGKRLITPLLVVLLSVALFFGSLFILKPLGLYQVSLPSAEEIQETGEYIGFADLRGSMTIAQGAYYTGIDLENFYEIMEIPQQIPAEMRMKEVGLYVDGYDFHVIKASR